MGKEWMKVWSMRVLMMDGRIHKVENLPSGLFFYTGVYVILKNLTPLFLYRGVCFPEKSPPPLLKIIFPIGMFALIFSRFVR